MSDNNPTLIDRKQIASMAGLSVRTVRRLERDIDLKRARSHVSRHPYLFRADMVRRIFKTEGVNFIG